MKIFKWEDYKFKIFNLTLFKLGKKKDGINFYIFFIPIIKFRNKFSLLSEEIKANKNFDMSYFDEKISSMVENRKEENIFFDKKKIAYLATELYDVGGHTKCLSSQIKSLHQDYEQCLFLTKMTSSLKNAPKSIDKLKDHTKIKGINENLLFYKKQIKKLYKNIIEFGAKNIFVYIHPDDILATATLALIKKNTNINIIFFNHASHYPNLGMTFADLILEGTPSTEKVTNNERHLFNCKVIGLQSKKNGETIYLSNAEKIEIKRNLGIKENELVTMSGGASYKFFENNTSEYFEMIKSILTKQKNSKHIIMSKFTKNEYKIINDIFKNSKLKNQLIFLPLSEDYEKYFQIADLFIDSFPVSSALTQIDLMRLKVASVVKINKKNKEWSFEEYQPKDYQYMFETTEEMEKNILFLLNNAEKRKEIINSNYNFWLNTYEENCVKQKYIECINNFSEEVRLINFNSIPYELQLETRNWRNSKHITEFFKIQKIEEATHIKWLESLNKDRPNNIAFLIEYKNKPIGVTYFHSINYKTFSCDWGIYIYEQNYQGKKIGDTVLKKSIEYAKLIGIKKINLDVLNTNKNARKLYENNGFKKTEKSKDDFLRYEKII